MGYAKSEWWVGWRVLFILFRGTEKLKGWKSLTYRINCLYITEVLLSKFYNLHNSDCVDLVENKLIKSRCHLM